MTEMIDERVLTATHEVLHATAAWALGREISKVSLNPEHGHFGETWYSTAAFDGPIPPPSVLPPRDFRDWKEAGIVISLAGSFAADLIREHDGFRDVPSDEEWAKRAAHELATQSPRHQELDARAQRGEFIWPDKWPMSADDQQALDGSKAVAGSDLEAAYHYAWMKQVAYRLVQEHWPRIQRLAAALLAEPSGELTGTQATAIIEGDGAHAVTPPEVSKGDT